MFLLLSTTRTIINNNKENKMTATKVNHNNKEVTSSTSKSFTTFVFSIPLQESDAHALIALQTGTLRTRVYHALKINCVPSAARAASVVCWLRCYSSIRKRMVKTETRHKKSGWICWWKHFHFILLRLSLSLGFPYEHELTHICGIVLRRFSYLDRCYYYSYIKEYVWEFFFWIYTSI